MVSSTMPPVSRCSNADSVDVWRFKDARDAGVIDLRKASAPGPENSCWTLYMLAEVNSERDRSLHVPDVEQAGLLSCPMMRLHNTQIAVLNWHSITAEWHEFGAISRM